MCCISDLNHARTGRSPAGLWVSPEEFEVDNGVWWCGLNKLFEDWRPLDCLHAGHGLHSIKHFLLVNGVAPALLLRTGDLV